MVTMDMENLHLILVMEYQMAVDSIHQMDQMVLIFREMDMENLHLILVMEYQMVLGGSI
jgi:hypothetical protein